MGRVLRAPSLDDARAARSRIENAVIRTPLVKLDGDPGDPEIYLKLENLQPIGSFKLRGALNRMRSLPRGLLSEGVYTASAGNMAQGVAWAARELGVSASVVVPDTAPKAKLDAIARLGAKIVSVPYDEWWTTMQSHGRPGMRGVFVHPFADPEVMAGNGTIALEILEDLPDVDAILVPWGGGGLTCGIATVARALAPAAGTYACEVDGAAPLAAAIAAGEPVAIENRRSFIDGIGGRGVFGEIWPLARELVTNCLTASVNEVGDAVVLLARRARIVAEGAGATPVAVARNWAKVHPQENRPKRLVCVVSGGNIDAPVLASLLAGNSPN
ncbi:MAG TPA: threonine/serine dehydratase [Gemmatimonadaceae bacterium]|nr:threonine/serine dehydratase [Gemmatimonadaceae bacterium]